MAMAAWAVVSARVCGRPVSAIARSAFGSRMTMKRQGWLFRLEPD